MTYQIHKDFSVFPYGDGEGTAYERFRLFSWVKLASPRLILEVGTGTGATSFFMAEALKESRPDGIIYTCDPRPRHSRQLETDYPNIRFHKDYSTDLIARMILLGEIPEFVFLDGPEDAQLHLNDFQLLDQVLSVGTFFAMHDWEYEPRAYDGNRSIKSAMLRPYIESNKNWKLIEYVSGFKQNGEGFPVQNGVDSVGLCLYQKC
jgi:predicted O-methyltransferase YrrM